MLNISERPLAEMDVLQALNWRYATKAYDRSKSVPDQKLERILEAIRLAPTSSGLQPFEVFVVTNPDIRAAIRPIAFDQSQTVDASHLLVFAAWDDTTPERINMMFDLTNTVRGTVNEYWENYRQMVLGLMASRGGEINFQNAAKQAYIGLGVGMIAAAAEQVDSTPMEGFDPDPLDGILGLRDLGLRSVVLLAIGYRDAGSDWLVGLQKVRRAREAFITDVR